MKKATLTLGAGLILLTGWLLVPGIASAQALKTPIEGSHTSCIALGEPERESVDEDGIRHFRGQRYRCLTLETSGAGRTGCSTVTSTLTPS